ncbi:hypothetical protein [Paracoccus fontiphilus]|uniref:Uncharacterized protein n=1 Tax=Paracoccus fontiphilus TaxID=1815556 RepID=A0ABV7IDN7_9RHOB|nr:hypothetical protein [Paracoccus fontiphilus]
MLNLIVAFLLIYPAALIGGMLHYKVGLRFKALRWPLIALSWFALLTLVMPVLA